MSQKPTRSKIAKGKETIESDLVEKADWTHTKGLRQLDKHFP